MRFAQTVPFRVLMVLAVLFLAGVAPAQSGKGEIVERAARQITEVFNKESSAARQVEIQRADAAGASKRVGEYRNTFNDASQPDRYRGWAANDNSVAVQNARSREMADAASKKIEADKALARDQAAINAERRAEQVRIDKANAEAAARREEVARKDAARAQEKAREAEAARLAKATEYANRRAAKDFADRQAEAQRKTLAEAAAKRAEEARKAVESQRLAKENDLIKQQREKIWQQQKLDEQATLNAKRALEHSNSKALATRAGHNGMQGPPREVHRITRGGHRGVNQVFPDGSVKDITPLRVKEYVPNQHPKAPSTAKQRVKFDDPLPGSKGFKRSPTSDELGRVK
jgi:hypothetical protein